MIERDQIEELNKVIKEITVAHNQKVRRILEQIQENSDNGSSTIIDPQSVQSLQQTRAQLNCLHRIRNNCLQIIYDVEWLKDSFNLLNK